jgi:hypothetical protein
MTGSSLKNLQILASLCGQHAIPSVVIATTMWSEVSEEEGKQREEELRAEFWKDIIPDGCRTERFQKTYESAWRIIGNISQETGNPKPLDESSAVSDANKRLNSLSRVMSHPFTAMPPPPKFIGQVCRHDSIVV